MEVKGEGYHISYDATTATVALQGVLRLRGVTEYASIEQLLGDVVALKPSQITLDLRKLRFLNSSGINILFRFVIQVREQGNSQLVVQGSPQIPWQKKSLQNLQRLMTTVQLKWV
ncbi:MAG: hypothetical protein JW953_01105 [Anaerolineae bacterium]|nr:hypothetical protein [Anaerolineae bacterium]